MPRPTLRRAATACAVALAAAAAFLGASRPASAAPVNASFAPTISGSASLGTYFIHDTDQLGSLWAYNLTVSVHANWVANVTTNIGWHDDQVRQGGDVPVARISPFQTGHIDVTWTITGQHAVAGVWSGVNETRSATAYCQPVTVGGSYSCQANASAFGLYWVPSPASKYTDLYFSTKLDITPEGAIATRGFDVGGAAIGSSPKLGLDTNLVNDTLTVPCGSSVGDMATYRLSPYEWSPAVTASQIVSTVIGPTDLTGFVKMPYTAVVFSGTTLTTHPVFDLTGAGTTTTLGPVLANNVKPAIFLQSNYTGKAGNAVWFNAVTSGPCGIDSYKWTLSDGTTLYGKSPNHAFGAPGTYSGELTVEDSTGLTAKRDFTVTISA